MFNSNTLNCTHICFVSNEIEYWIQFLIFSSLIMHSLNKQYKFIFCKAWLGMQNFAISMQMHRMQTQDFNHLHLDLKILLLYQDLPWLLSYIHYNKPWIVEKNLLLGLLLTNTFILVLYWRLIFFGWKYSYFAL